LLTILLNALFLILGGRANWHSLVAADVSRSLAAAVLEGVILGFTVGFLARVKPEMLLGYRRLPVTVASQPLIARPSKSSTLVLAVVIVLASPGLLTRIALMPLGVCCPIKRIQVQSFFAGGYPRAKRPSACCPPTAAC